MNDQLLTLDRLLAFHDWYYNYSDDHSVYCRGRDQRNAIDAEAARLKNLGLVTEVDELVAKYAKG
jgi:hypothetical protein